MLFSLQKSHQAGEGGQRQALPLERVPCPGRTKDAMLGASPPRTLPTSLACPAVPARAVPAGGSLSRCANKAVPKEKGQEGEGTALGEAAQLGLGLVCCLHPCSALPAGGEQPQAEAAVPQAKGSAAGRVASRPRREKRDLGPEDLGG